MHIPWKSPWIGLGLALAAAGLLAAFAPVEKTLGANARIVYLHGAWVWVAMLCFLLAALAGLAGLAWRHAGLQDWSLALGRTGLCYWVTFLPMSLWVMQANWNGLFLDEPRFRIPLNYAIVGLLLQVGLAFFGRPSWAALANIGFAVALFTGISRAEYVLHPDSPIFNAEAGAIRLFFIGLLILLAAGAGQLARGWRQLAAGRAPAGELQRDPGQM